MKRTILFAAILVTLVGCSDRHPQQYQQPPVVYQQPAPVYQQPVVVQQHDNSAATLATGVALGHMMSQGNRDRDYREPTRVIERRTVIVNQQQVPVQSPSTYNRAMPAPSPVTRPGQSLYIPPTQVKPAPYVATSYAPRNVVTPVMAPRPVVTAPRPTTSYAPARPTTSYSAPSRPSSYSAPSRSTTSFSTTKSTTSTTSSFKR